MSREEQKGPCVGGGRCELAAVGGSRHVISAVRRWTTCSPCTASQTVPAARRRWAAGPCTWQYRYGHLRLDEEGHFGVALGPPEASRGACGRDGAAALESWSRKKKGSKEDGEAILVATECRPGAGGQAGARQTDSDEQRFRRGLDILIGSAGVELVQEPGRGWMLVQVLYLSRGPGPLCPRAGQSKGARSQSVTKSVRH
jgi:hypothetical protein